jgi:hypothetical protein
MTTTPDEATTSTTVSDLGISDLRVDRTLIEHLRRGILCQVSIRAWSASARLDEADLGLDLGPETPRLSQTDPVRLGAKRLLPRRLDQQLETAIRSVRDSVYDRAFKTTWGFFVPVTAYLRWNTVFEERAAAFFAVRDRLVAEYEVWREELLTEYQPVIQAAYWRATRMHPGMTLGQDAYHDRYVRAILDQIPARDTLAAEFACSATKTFIPLEGYLETPRATSTGDSAQQRMERDVLREAQAAKRERIDGFFKDVSVQLRSLVYDATTSVLASVTKNGNLGGSSARQLRNLVMQVEELNFLDDEELTSGIDRIRGLLEPAPKDRSMLDITVSLRDLAIVTRAALLDLGEKPRTARDLGVADVPDQTLVVRARRNLGVTLDTAGDAVTPNRRLDRERFLATAI